MKKNGIVLGVLIVVVLVVVAVAAVFILKIDSKKNPDIIKQGISAKDAESKKQSKSSLEVISEVETEKIVVVLYDSETGRKKKKVVIDSPKEIEKVTGYISKIKLFEDGKTLNLALVQYIEIKYNEEIVVSIAANSEYYCTYANVKEGVGKMAHLPKELYQWAEKVVE